jgi:hypothetical protein
MRVRLSFILALVAASFIACNSSSAQTFGGFCTAGLQPDGYIDFSGLPTAPVVSTSSPTPPVTAVLPVPGVPGLTVTVTIPSLSPRIPVSSPAYSTVGGTLQLNGFPASSDSTAPSVLTLQFNQPITGVGVDMSTSGRFTFTYALRVGLPTDEPPAFVTTANGYFQGIPSPQSQSLQLVGMTGTFQTASIQFLGDPEEYSEITLSNIRVQSSSAPNPASVVPTSGLQQWLRADTGNIYQPNPIWKDQSGHGHDATASANPPGLTYDGHHCKPAFVFGGNQSFSFNLPIAGWSQMTVFLVAKATTDGTPGAYFSRNSAILWTEDAQWGNTFVSPYQTHAYARFGTTQPGNNLSYTRPGGGVGQDFTITRAEHNLGTDRILVNGVQVFQQTGKLSALSGVSGAGTIGEGINGTYFNGEISEILIYDRVLSTNEEALVESYLSNKYGTQ